MSLSTAATETRSLSDYMYQGLTALSDVDILIDDVELSRVEAIPGGVILHRALRVADCLLAMGLKSGNVVVVFCESRSEMVWMIVGALMVGVAVAFIDSGLEDRDVRNALIALQPSQIYASEHTSSRLLRLCRGHYRPRSIILFGDEFLGRSIFLSFNVIVRDSRVKTRMSDEVIRKKVAPRPEQTAFIGFSCDKMGRFKFAYSSHSDVLDGLVQDGLASGSSKCISKMPPWVDLDDVIANFRSILSLNSSAKL